MERRNAKGFESLHKNDQELKDLEIDIELADTLNKNSNAVVDKSCQELEEELRKLSPEGNKISQATLARAVMLVNKKMRREGTLTDYQKLVEIASGGKHTRSVNGWSVLSCSE